MLRSAAVIGGLVAFPWQSIVATSALRLNHNRWFSTFAPSVALRRSEKLSSDAPPMFCYQCEQTENRRGCTKIGMCGKDSDVAALQDIAVYALKGLSTLATSARTIGMKDSEPALAAADSVTIRTLFSTLTNVNFDPKRFVRYLEQIVEVRDDLRRTYDELCQQQGISPAQPIEAEQWQPKSLTLEEEFTVEDLVDEGKRIGLWERMHAYGDHLVGLQETIIYGLKGAAAYACHASAMKPVEPESFKEFHRLLAFAASGEEQACDESKLVQAVLDTGKLNLEFLRQLDTAHNERFGEPSPDQMRISAVKGKAILVSGHDLLDLEDLLKQTENAKVNVYTHGEMLPAHNYPKLRAFKHLIGNWGGPWQIQQSEFPRFPGPVVMTTNCLIQPRDSYKNRLYTMNEVGWPGNAHIPNSSDQPQQQLRVDYSDVIRQAQQLNGFAKDEPARFVTVGFGRAFMQRNIDLILKLIKSGNLKRIVAMGGCDGTEGERSYFTKFAKLLPQNSAILTFGCGKYRFHRLDLGKIPGTDLPRILDMGQCNDSYGAVALALSIANKLNCSLNDLPISVVLSWFEQKAVADFLTLLYLRIKNIRIGPAMPAFMSPQTLRFLVEKFNVIPIQYENADRDVKLVMEGRDNEVNQPKDVLSKGFKEPTASAS